MTKERPILFSAPMVRAILSGAKTQTRRIIKPQPEPKPGGVHWMSNRDVQMMIDIEGFLVGDDPTVARCFCPHGNVGDRLWVRETWGTISDGMESPICYRADAIAQWRTNPKTEVERRAEGISAEYIEPAKWRPSIFMPRWASRITLEITDVQVERVNDISEADAMAEGMGEQERTACMTPDGFVRCDWPQWSFRKLWQTINGADSWAANPWVWAISFRRLQ